MSQHHNNIIIESEPRQPTRPRLFQEIIPNRIDPIDLLPDEIETYVSKVSPAKCATLVKELGYILPLIKYDDARYYATDEITGEKKTYPWPALGHLRRVRRILRRGDCDEIMIEGGAASPIQTRTEEQAAVEPKNDCDDTNEKPSKRRKRKNNPNSCKSTTPNKVDLEIVIGSTRHVDFLLQTEEEHGNQVVRTKLLNLISTHELQLEKRLLPGRPAKSQSELDEWTSRNDGKGWWPTIYFEKQSAEFREKEMQLSLEEEWDVMRKFLLEAVKDAQEYSKHGLGHCFQGQGVVIVCPLSKKVVSRSFVEWTTTIKEKVQEDDIEKQEYVKRLLLGNPLNTPVLFAIQGVSRIERQVALGQGIHSESFQQGQYLCTGYDVYLTKEPSVYESMAMVHSRVRRVVYGLENKEDGGLGGTGDETSVHCLPGTNHRYRAFKCIPDDQNELYQILLQASNDD